MTDKPETVADVLKWLHACAKDAKDRGHQLAPSVFTTIANRIERAMAAEKPPLYRVNADDGARIVECERCATLAQPAKASGSVPDVEAVAMKVYEAMRFGRKESTPAWVEGGNSDAQDIARSVARTAMLAAPPPASVPDGFVLIDRADLVGIARILERDGDEHGAARELRNLLRTTPEESP